MNHTLALFLLSFAAASAQAYLIFRGDADDTVLCPQSDLLYEALAGAHVPVAFYKITEAGHGGAEFDTPMVRAAIAAFFDQHLKSPASR